MRRAAGTERAMPSDQTPLDFVVHDRSAVVQVGARLISRLRPDIGPDGIHEIGRPGGLRNCRIVGEALGGIVRKIQRRPSLEWIEPTIQSVTAEPISTIIPLPIPG